MNNRTQQHFDRSVRESVSETHRRHSMSRPITLLSKGHRCNRCGAVMADICDLEDHIALHRFEPTWRERVLAVTIIVLAIAIVGCAVVSALIGFGVL